MFNDALDLTLKKDNNRFKQKKYDRVRFQIYGLSLDFQVWMYDAILDIGYELGISLNDKCFTMLRWLVTCYILMFEYV